ncbi:MAG: hypothetical protein Q8J78_14875 [Moraxellaceae bacterium]|nr:hypothetical protein [Moraxellaceae bacterium]
MTDAVFQPLLRATRSRCVRVRLLMWLLPWVPLVFAGIVFTADVAELAPATAAGEGPAQLIALYVAVLLSALPALAAWYLHDRYVAELALDAEQRRLRVTLVRAFGQRVLEAPIADFRPGGTQATGAPGTGVHTPSGGLHAPDGRRLLVDLQAEFPLGQEIVFELLHNPERACRRLPGLLRRQGPVA